jgi:hypothetical protein
MAGGRAESSYAAVATKARLFSAVKIVRNLRFIFFTLFHTFVAPPLANFLPTILRFPLALLFAVS